MKEKVVVLGAGGQLGRELLVTVPSGVDCTGLVRAELDIAHRALLGPRLAELSPQLVINAAAYTAVDAAESEPAEAGRANAQGPADLAAICSERGIRLLHISTDFVFDGESSTPYQTTAATAPLGEYGRSKLAGEREIQRLLPGALIMRTGWVYSRFGNNFVKTMLRLMAQRDELAVVADQVGTPTWARGLANALWAAAGHPELQGVYHWSDEGQCSWYDFALAICEEALDLGLLSRPVVIRPIPGSDYPTAAKRPSYSVLDKTRSWQDLSLPAIPWRTQLRSMLIDLKESENE